MRIVNLVENTPGVPGCKSAHGLSFYIEIGCRRLLLDAGPGGVLLDNAKALGVDLSAVDTVILTHGHYDHGDGLPFFAQQNPRAKIYLHAGAELPRYSLDEGGYRYNGLSEQAKALPQLVPVRGTVVLDEALTLFDGPGHDILWPQSNRRLLEGREGRYVQDAFTHEHYLLIREGEKRVLLSGCAHNGLLNILARFRTLFGGEPDAVVSGFHLMKRSGNYTAEDWETIRETARRLKKTECRFYTCHCTGLEPYKAMKEILGERLHYVHCGETLVL